MCKSLAEGGQRCSAHTRPRFDAAPFGTPEWDEAAAEHASTHAGWNELKVKLETANEAQDVERIVALENALSRGATFRAVAAETAERVKDKDIPVFVYGTLRHGLHNYGRILNGATVAEEPATLQGVAMHSNGGFPYVVEGEPQDVVVGELMHLDPDERSQTMQNLDWLEGYRGADERNHYERNLVEVETANGETVTAWAYVAEGQTASHARSLQRVPSGDWAKRRTVSTPVVEDEEDDGWYDD